MKTTTRPLSTTTPTDRPAATTYPAWSRRSSRALPTIERPRLTPIERAQLGNERRLAIIMISRVLVAAAAFIGAALAGWWPVAIAATWLVYGSAITTVHHLIHGSLGMRPRARRFWLRTIAALVVESGHALQVTHLQHHRGAADLPDPEGYIENVTWRQLPLAALQFRYRLMFWGWRYGPHRRRVTVEIVFHAGAHLGALVLLPLTPLPWIYLSLIHVASFAFAALAGKGPQTNWGRQIASPFVKVTTRVGRIVLFSHDRHLEHHIYPKVPLPFLAQLDDRVAPILDELDIVDVRMGF